MCRKSPSCVLLGDDISVWSVTSPLPPPTWFHEELLIFRDAVEKASLGDCEASINILGRIRSDEMRHWFDDHGQVSGNKRARRLGIVAPTFPADQYDLVRSPSKLEKAVYARDSYTCRYCGLRQVAKEVLYAFEKAVGVSEFRMQGTNAQQHGIVHGFKIVADHVVPYKRGGRTDLNNLVSSCPGCNYGKEAYTIEQLGIDDPRLRPPADNGWDGMLSLLEGLQNNDLRVT